MNTGMAFTKRDAGVEAGLRVEALRLLGADGEVAHEHVGVGVAQHLRDVDRLGRRLLDRLAVVLAEAVERRAALHLDLELADVGELDGVVLPGRDRLAEVEPDLGGVDVERGDEVDVADVVAAEHDVHEARHVLVGVGVAVVLDALDEAAGAVPDSGDGDTNATTHDAVAPSCAGCDGVGVIGSASSRPSAAISASTHSRSRWVDWVRCSKSDARVAVAAARRRAPGAGQAVGERGAPAGEQLEARLGIEVTAERELERERALVVAGGVVVERGAGRGGRRRAR